MKTNKQIKNRLQGSRDILILAIVAVVLVLGLVFILLKILGQSEKHVEKVRKTKVNYEESLAWRPDKDLSEKAILKDLRKNPHRKKAIYRDMNLTRKSMKYIGQMSNVEDLRLTNSIAKDPWLKYVKDLPIRSIDLYGTLVTDKCVTYLLALKHLKHVGLGHTDISDKGLVLLANHPRLRSIELDQTSITDEGVESLTKLKLLHNLDLSDTHTTSGAIDAISSMKKLTSLSLKGIKLEGDSVKKLEKLKKLRYLNLTDCQISDDQLKTINNLKKLTRLKISANNELTDKCLKAITKLNMIELLEMQQCPNITDGAAKAFRKKHPHCRVKHSQQKGNIPGGFHFEGLDQEAEFIEKQLLNEVKKKK